MDDQSVIDYGYSIGYQETSCRNESVMCGVEMTKRDLKIAGLLKAEISAIIQTKIKDPRIGFVTITDVVLSSDLRIARVYFSVLGGNDQVKKSLEGLGRACTYIQSELSSRVSLRFLPVLHFYFDGSYEYGARIDRIIQDLHLDEQKEELKKCP